MKTAPNNIFLFATHIPSPCQEPPLKEGSEGRFKDVGNTKP